MIKIIIFWLKNKISTNLEKRKTIAERQTFIQSHCYLTLKYKLHLRSLLNFTLVCIRIYFLNIKLEGLHLFIIITAKHIN